VLILKNFNIKLNIKENCTICQCKIIAFKSILAVQIFLVSFKPDIYLVVGIFFLYAV